jgi:hypothetical protein
MNHEITTRNTASAARLNPHAYRIGDLTHQNGGVLGRTNICKAISEGRLRAKKFGGATLILEKDWLSFLESLPDVRPSVSDDVVA